MCLVAFAEWLLREAAPHMADFSVVFGLVETFHSQLRDASAAEFVRLLRVVVTCSSHWIGVDRSQTWFTILQNKCKERIL